MARTGKAAVFLGPGQPFELRELPLPELEPGAVLVRGGTPRSRSRPTAGSSVTR